MVTESFEISVVIPANPNGVYDAWVQGEKHAQMTGGAATGRPESGAEFTAWDGYISGTNLELVPGERIVQTWRTTQFPKSSADSRIEVTLEPVGSGTKLTLRHTEIPDGRAKSYEKGWADHYFEPMKSYFSGG